MAEQQEILDLDINGEQLERRRKLLPWWIKTFAWIFMIMGAIAPLGLILGFMNLSFKLSLLGLETHNPLSITGIILIAIFSLKGMASFGLWTEKDWGIKLAQTDAIIGILICCYTMLNFTGNTFGLNFRLELILLIPYLYKLQNIKKDWEKAPRG